MAARWASRLGAFAAPLADASSSAQGCALEGQSLVIELDGPLGAGKTTFVRHLLRALGVTGRIKSPTYALIEPYDIDGLAVSHLDLYRMDDPREWVDAGLRDVYAQPGIKLVEWAGHAGAQRPPADLRLVLGPMDEPASAATVSDESSDTPASALRAVRIEVCSAAGAQVAGVQWKRSVLMSEAAQ